LAHIPIVSASIGAGHDGVAHELGIRLERRGVQVTQLDFLDLLPSRLGQWLRRAYAVELTHVPNTWGWLLNVLQRQHAASIISAVSGRAAASRTKGAMVPEPAAIVSTYPLASQVLGQLRSVGALTAPVITYLTDMSVHRLWVAPGVDLHLAVDEVPARQARALGAFTHVIEPATADQFHTRSTPAERLAVRQRYGIPANRPAALVVGGSWGVGQLSQTMADIAATGVAVPVALCGNNSVLRDRLNERDHGPALGWVDEMGELIRACDVVVQNAGGLTSLQSLASGVPVISYRCVSGHGITNAMALEEAGCAPWVRHRIGLAHALRMAMASTAPCAGGRDDPADVITELAGIAKPVVRREVPLPRRMPVVSPRESAPLEVARWESEAR
jgi:UDP-N-acetylglucosamine:LPS N-acetylglucosamine transferase